MKILKPFLFLVFAFYFFSCDQKASPTNSNNNDDTEVTTNNDNNNPGNNTGTETPEDTTAANDTEFGDLKLSTTSYMKAEENQMVNEINLIRTNPPGYVEFVGEYIAQMEKDKADGTAFSNVDDEIATAHELIAELENLSPLAFLEPNQKIYDAAVKHGDEGKAKGSLDHQGSDGKWPWDRVKAAAPECADGNENLVGGSSDVRRSVMMLLVDSGVPGRGHRKTLLNPAWTEVACYSVGQVGQMPNYWVQKFGKCN